MYHHQHQPSYNPYATPDPPQYASQYGNWPEQPGQHDPMTPHSFSGSFHQQSRSQYHQYPQYPQQYHQYPSQNQSYSSPNQQYNPQPQHPSPAPHLQRRTSAQERWDNYIMSAECSDTLQGGTPHLPIHQSNSDPLTANCNKADNQMYVHQVTSELEQRALADERLEGLSQQHGVETQHAQQAERDRRLRWAQEMIIQNPALCAEVYCAMSKLPASRRRGSSTAVPPPPSSRSNSNSSVNSSNSSYRNSPTITTLPSR
ncbi:hypothetical protein BFW01_g11031 [Lasiodiplodia theobromae]|nr:hypothetical protein BFW01_g11031 [Lasiodiplodia theobromae]